MIRLLGYSLMSVGLLVFIFFLKYNGSAFPLKALWIVLSITTIAVGSYFVAKYKLQKLNNQNIDNNSYRLIEIEQLKLNGDKVRVTLDNAEVKSRSYQQEIINNDWPSQVQMLDGLYDGNRNYKTQEIQQTYIVFYKQYGSKQYKYISQATKQSADVVKRYIDAQNGIDLYIDPKNPTNYHFALPFV